MRRTLRTILSPVKEIMPDRCTPEYERVLVEFRTLLPYRRARTLLGTFFPVGDLPAVDTIQRRTLQVGARLECEAIVTPTPLPPAADAETIALTIDSGHVRAVRRNTTSGRSSVMIGLAEPDLDLLGKLEKRRTEQCKCREEKYGSAIYVLQPHESE